MSGLNWDRPKVYATRYATEKQRSYLRRLMKTKELNQAQRRAYGREVNGELTLDRASHLIEVLNVLPDRPVGKKAGAQKRPRQNNVGRSRSVGETNRIVESPHINSENASRYLDLS